MTSRALHSDTFGDVVNVYIEQRRETIDVTSVSDVSRRFMPGPRVTDLTLEIAWPTDVALPFFGGEEFDVEETFMVPGGRAARVAGRAYVADRSRISLRATMTVTLRGALTVTAVDPTAESIRRRVREIRRSL